MLLAKYEDKNAIIIYWFLFLKSVINKIIIFKINQASVLRHYNAKRWIFRVDVQIFLTLNNELYNRKWENLSAEEYYLEIGFQIVTN